MVGCPDDPHAISIPLCCIVREPPGLATSNAILATSNAIIAFRCVPEQPDWPGWPIMARVPRAPRVRSRSGHKQTDGHTDRFADEIIWYPETAGAAPRAAVQVPAKVLAGIASFPLMSRHILIMSILLENDGGIRPPRASTKSSTSSLSSSPSTPLLLLMMMMCSSSSSSPGNFSSSSCQSPSSCALGVPQRMAHLRVAQCCV